MNAKPETTLEKLLYGCAYYDEYMPYERLEKDMQMMQEANINVIRIAESTWAAEEPQNGVFDFTHITRALQAAEKAGISVIVGTPTYAIPPWLAAQHPEILATTEHGPEKYGRRQNMDITSPVYLFHAERIIRRLMEHVQQFPNVIGFQLDNETKHYHTAGPNVQKRFVRHLRETFGTAEEMNRVFGFHYWSNTVDSWENLPDVTGTINGSFAAEFEKFRRNLVTEFLSWQSQIVQEYLRDRQFITHNFDYAWRNYSFGVQPDVNHRDAAAAVSIAGCDIYHLSQDDLTGKEIAMGGDICRSLKQSNYLVLETQAQGHVNWTPYPGQLRLQAFSHIASGANSVMYWHWHSIHNACETYWKGLLSHDLQPNAPYREATTIGADFRRLSPQLSGLKKKNRAAILVSNEALSAIEQFRLPDGKTDYNDVFRRMYDALYELNVECDILFPKDSSRFSDYALLLVPALYSAPDSLLKEISQFVKNGGEAVLTFKSGFANEFVKVRCGEQPGLLGECCGITYDQFTAPKNGMLKSDCIQLPEEMRSISVWMELLRPTTAKTIASYDHPFWGEYAAVTENSFGKGHATYMGCYPTLAYVKEILKPALSRAGLWAQEQSTYPVVIKSAENQLGKTIRFYFNYSGHTQTQTYLHKNAVELLSGHPVTERESLTLAPWEFYIFEET